MAKVIGFRPAPISPFLGKWILDPLSVSRNKVVKHALGQDGLKKLWACGSMQERAQCLAAEPELAKRYESLLRMGRESNVVVTHQAITFTWARAGSSEDRTTAYPVMSVAAEGRKVIVHTVDPTPERRGRQLAYVLRLQKQWLFVSEQYKGREALYFPRSPVFRYYASN